TTTQIFELSEGFLRSRRFFWRQITRHRDRQSRRSDIGVSRGSSEFVKWRSDVENTNSNLFRSKSRNSHLSVHYLCTKTVAYERRHNRIAASNQNCDAACDKHG